MTIDELVEKIGDSITPDTRKVLVVIDPYTKTKPITSRLRQEIRPNLEVEYAYRFTPPGGHPVDGGVDGVQSAGPYVVVEPLSELRQRTSDAVHALRYIATGSPAIDGLAKELSTQLDAYLVALDKHLDS